MRVRRPVLIGSGIIGVVLAAAPRVARADSTVTLTEKVFDATTLHIANEGGASNWTKTKEPVWSCSAKAPDTLGESSSWLFGKTGCIQTGEGRRGAQSFQACKP